jgi:hypothetical protein
MVEILEEAVVKVKEPASSSSMDPTVVETEMHEYNVLRYGKKYQRGQDTAPRKRIKFSKSISPPAKPSSAQRTRSHACGGISKLSKLRNTASNSEGQN